MAEVWVVDASPIIALAHADALGLLEDLPAELVIPDAVADEILSGPEDPAHRALAAGWGRTRPAVVPEIVAEWSLGRGESAVLALALELGATAVLADRNARRWAKTHP